MKYFQRDLINFLSLNVYIENQNRTISKFVRKNMDLGKGPFKYYTIKILIFLDPNCCIITHTENVKL